MQLVDLIFVVLLFVVQPIHGYFENRRYTARALAGEPFDRVRFYRLTMLIEWAFFAALAAAWWLYGRPLADLGVVAVGGPAFWGGAALLLVLTGVLLYSWRTVVTASDSEKEKQREALGDLEKFLPRTAEELRAFVRVSITAGIVEEIVYRGFVIWFLVQFMPIWAAVIVSSVAFGLAHSYQGAKGALRTGLVGLAFGIYYIVTGSIWLPIVAHVLLDVLQGAAIHELLRKGDEAAEPAPA